MYTCRIRPQSWYTPLSSQIVKTTVLLFCFFKLQLIGTCVLSSHSAQCGKMEDVRHSTVFSHLKAAKKLSNMTSFIQEDFVERNSPVFSAWPCPWPALASFSCCVSWHLHCSGHWSGSPAPPGSSWTAPSSAGLCRSPWLRLTPRRVSLQ